MAVKDISDLEVCQAYRDFRVVLHSERRYGADAATLLQQRTGQPYKVCLRACERALNRDLVDYGVRLAVGFLTPKGKRALGMTDAEIEAETRALMAVPR